MRRTAALLAAILGISTIAATPAFAQTTAPDATGLVINEVESDADATDWVEFYNTTSAPIDASGLRITDDNPSRTLTIPEGTIVPAGGFYAIDVSVGAGSFGLGNGDEVHLYQGDVELDSFTFARHASVTWGACPDGSGVFVDTAVATKGGPNACSVDPAEAVTINEVESSGGTPGDWIELYNSATVPVAIGGLVLKDNDDTHAFTIPAGTMIDGKGFAAFDVDVVGGFGLGANDSARLFQGSTLIDSYAWTRHASTTWGACPDGSDVFAETSVPTKGAANLCPLPEGADELAINEVQSQGTDWVEIHNGGTIDVDISNWTLRDDNNGSVIPAGTIVPAGGFTVLTNGVDFTFGLGNGDEVRLLLPDGVTVVDEMSYATHPLTTWGRCPDGVGDFTLTVEPTPGAANACDVDPATAFVINEIESEGSDWVELYNTSLLEADASGLLLKDSGESNTITIPADSTVAAGGFLAVDVTGLGSADSARLFSADGETLIDSYSWTSHATQTYGRCPDGIGAFADTDAPTKGSANLCPRPGGADDIVINEIESSGGTPGDWVELYNTGTGPVDLTGWVLRDNDDSHTLTLPAGSSIGAGEYFTIDTEAGNGYGLGANDSVRLYLPGGTTIVDQHTWVGHAATTYGRCPDGTGDFITTFSSTKGAANDCSPVRINEVESSGGTPGDWIELANIGTESFDLSGYVLKDNDDSHAITLPSGTSIAAGGHLAVDTEGAGGFGLGASDSARLFDPSGALVSSYTWTSHAETTWARCPDGTGEFELAASSTKGAPNDCIGVAPLEPWDGPADVRVVDAPNRFGQDMSGLVYEQTASTERGILWAVNNGTGVLFRLLWNGDAWTPAAGPWLDGKALRYPDGTGTVDAEGVTIVDGDSAGGVYVASERNNAASGVSRPSVLRYDVAGEGSTLTATHEWNLSGTVGAIGANAGLEGIAWVPDAKLVEDGFVDQSTGLAYDPATYPGHGDGLFFVGVEADGKVYAVALNDDGTYAKVAEINPGLSMVAEVAYDAATGLLWAVCDDACAGQSVVLEVASEGPFAGSFVPTRAFENPIGMLDSIANEGFTIATADQCIDGTVPVFYADDSQTGGHALREAALNCTAIDPEPSPEPTETVSPSPSPEPTETVSPSPSPEPTTGPTTQPTPGPTALPTTGPAPGTAPAESELTDALKGLVRGPATVEQGGSVTVTLDTAFAGQTVYGWIFSTPVSLGSATVTAAGTATFTIPSNVPTGAHRIAVVSEAGYVIGWYDVTVTGAGGGLAVTGGQLAPFAPFAVILLAVGAGLLLARRRQEA